MNNYMKLEIPALSENEPFARSAVAAFCVSLNPSMDELSDVKTAVSEAVTNCIIHGYEDAEGIVKIRARIFKNNVEIEISDTGKGIENVELARKPLYTTKANLERSGMGFTIMESFMDEVEIDSVLGLGTKVTMRKKIKKHIVDDIETEFANVGGVC